MAMAMPMPEHKPEQLHLARLTVTLSGSLSNPLAQMAVDAFAQQITRVLEERHPAYAFPIMGETVSLGEFHVEIEDIENGSINARLLVIGNILFVGYTGIAAYPSFKDAIPVIRADFELILAEAGKHFETESPTSDIQYEYSQVVLFKEEDLEAELDRLRGFH